MLSSLYPKRRKIKNKVGPKHLTLKWGSLHERSIQRNATTVFIYYFFIGFAASWLTDWPTYRLNSIHWLAISLGARTRQIIPFYFSNSQQTEYSSRNISSDITKEQRIRGKTARNMNIQVSYDFKQSILGTILHS